MPTRRGVTRRRRGQLVKLKRLRQLRGQPPKPKPRPVVEVEAPEPETVRALDIEVVAASDPPPIRPTTHAVERYQERVRDIGFGVAHAELSELLRTAEVRPDPPPGIIPEERPACWAWLTPDGNIICPLVRDGDVLLAVSVMTRQSLSPAARERRNGRKACKRAGRAAARHADRRSKGRARPIIGPVADDDWGVTETGVA